MPIQADKIWLDGQLVDFSEAKIHILSHVVHYGTGAFEGIRLYEVGDKSAIFRLDEHTRRLYDTCKIYRMPVPYTPEELNQAIVETLHANKLKSAYIRPLIYRGFAELGVNPSDCPVQAMVAAWSWGKYLGPEALEKGVKVCISSWQRSAPNTFPSLAKACGNYLNSQLIKTEALQNGYDEGIALDTSGNVSEGSGENIFVVRDNILYTPAMDQSILPGITRDAVVTLAEKIGYKVVFTTVPREMLYIADEVFFCGTAAEITPVTSIDKVTIGDGKRGTICKQIQDAFFEVIETGNDPENWLTYI